MDAVLRFTLEYVDRIPRELLPGKVYVSRKFEVGALLCPCGQNHRIDLLIGDGHRVVDHDGVPTISPSIGAWNGKCRAHFWIKNGEVIWAEQWTEGKIKSAMEAQIKRHEAALERKSLTIRQRLGASLSWILSVFKTRA